MGKLKHAKNELFCQEYLKDINATQAYIRAGYNPKNVSQCASMLLAKPHVRARVDQLLAERSARTGVTQDRVVRELARIAFLDPTQLVDINDATVREDASEDDRAAIASVKLKSGEDYTEHEIKFADKNKALELLGKHLGMYTDKIDLTQDIVLDFSGGSPDGH